MKLSFLVLAAHSHAAITNIFLIHRKNCILTLACTSVAFVCIIGTLYVFNGLVPSKNTLEEIVESIEAVIIISIHFVKRTPYNNLSALLDNV